MRYSGIGVKAKGQGVGVRFGALSQGQVNEGVKFQSSPSRIPDLATLTRLAALNKPRNIVQITMGGHEGHEEIIFTMNAFPSITQKSLHKSKNRHKGLFERDKL
jgi:hypothetical protein